MVSLSHRSYNQALSAVRVAQERFERIGVPHVRPDDYFAEMVKTDKHMLKVKRRMLQEQSDLAAAEERRKQKSNKKFGKQDDYLPGMLGFDPLGADSPSMRNAEITNGRVAMLAITAYALEEAVTRAPIFPLSLFH